MNNGKKLPKVKDAELENVSGGRGMPVIINYDKLVCETLECSADPTHNIGYEAHITGVCAQCGAPVVDKK